MAVITPNTFDPTRRYVGVRLQQGVPIVDADWNELDDLVRFELRALRRWFIGNGIPSGSDAFHVEGTGLANDFSIRKGVPAGTGPNSVEAGLRFSGHCLVDGFSVLIPADIRFKQQPLHESNGTAADAEAARLGVGKVTELAAAGQVAVYLDAWERLVTPGEDAALVLGAIGTESCARIKREWVVRVRTGDTAPVATEPDFKDGHGYLLLATIARTAGQPNVNAGDVSDRRISRLSLSDMLERVGKIERLALQPAFGPVETEFNPKTGPVGNKVTLNGRNFNLGRVKVSFDGIAAEVGITTAATIETKVPVGATVGGAGLKIKVTTEGGETTSAGSFKVI